MYNSDIPSRAELPSSAQLLKSTIIAFVTAVILLFTVVLPSEYAYDPTGIGRFLKLTDMGEIKQQLAEEAEADRLKDAGVAPASPQQGSSLRMIFDELIGVRSAYAEDAMLAQAGVERTDETIITLNPSEGTEYKIALKVGDIVKFSWVAENGVVNYDMHGTNADGSGEESYKKDRGVAADEGELTAAYDGSHGWFFHNRGKEPVTIKLTTTGNYAEIKKVM